MNKLFFLLTALTLIWVSACRRPELQPDNLATVVDKEFANVPTPVVQAVRKAYPAATNLSFSELDKGKVWDSRFGAEARNYQARIDAKGAMLEVYAVSAFGERSGMDLPAAAQSTFMRSTQATELLLRVKGSTITRKPTRYSSVGKKKK
jgi:hypothetical protein